MTPQEYCAVLERALSAIPAEERQETVRYYREFLEDASDSERQALGTPEELAARILAENGVGGKPKNDHRGAIIAVLICTFYIWLPIGIAVYTVFLCAIVCVAAIWTALLASMVVCLFAGALTIPQDAPTALAAIGIGLICGGVGIMSLPVCFAAIRAIAGFTAFTFKKFWKLVSKKKEAA